MLEPIAVYLFVFCAIALFVVTGIGLALIAAWAFRWLVRELGIHPYTLWIALVIVGLAILLNAGAS